MYKELENGNMILKSDNVYMTDSHDDFCSAMDEIIDILDWKDAGFIGEDFCLGNFSTGAYVYNNRLDMIYIFDYSEVYDFMKGEKITLYAHEPDEDEKEIINDWYEYFN